MLSVHVVKHRGWYHAIVVRDGKRSRRSLKTRNAKVARSMRDDILMRERAGIDPIPSFAPAVSSIRAEPVPPVTVEVALDGYERYQRMLGNTPAHIANVASQIRLYVKHVGAQAMADITRPGLEGYLARCADKGQSPKTRRDKCSILKAWLGWSVSNGHLQGNPAAGIGMPRVFTKEPASYTADQLEKLLERVKGTDAEDLITVALFTGMRKSELLRLRGEWIHLDLREIHLPAEATKTRRWRRVIPILDQALPALMRLPRTDRVFPFSARGGFLARTLKHTFKMAGFKGKREGLGKIRHSTVTHALLNGVGPFVLHRWTGHGINVMLRSYAGQPGRPLAMTYFGQPLRPHGLPDVPPEVRRAAR